VNIVMTSAVLSNVNLLTSFANICFSVASASTPTSEDELATCGIFLKLAHFFVKLCVCVCVCLCVLLQYTFHNIHH